MSDTLEPLSAVLAETRKSLVDDSWIDEITALDEDGEPDDFARRVVPLDDALEAIDRIEAAAEREREINQKILAAANDANAILKDDRDRAIQFANAAPHPGSVSWKEMHEVYAKARAILSAVPKEGNAAAMRDALEAFVKSVEWLCDGDERGGLKRQFGTLLSYARAALSAPPRNCDVGTADEQAERFDAECKRHEHCTPCPVHREWGEFKEGKPKSCQMIWSQMPFAPAEGGAE